MMDRTQSEHKEREHFFAAAKVVAGLTVLSRIAGMLRAMAIASLGANALTDAFAFAFKIPNLFRRLFAEGALSSAFVPVFTETMEEGESGLPKASRLLANAMGLLALFMVSLMVVLSAGLCAWGTFWPGEADRQLLILLAVVMLPFMVTICLLALGSAALNCRGHFVYPASTPIIMNIIVVAAAWFVAPMWQEDLSAQLKVVAASITIAGIVQFAGVFWLLKRNGFALRPRLRPIEPGIRPMLRLMTPMLVGLGMLQFVELLETGIAWALRGKPGETINLFGWVLNMPLDYGVLQRLDAARYLYQFPLGVLATSLGVAVFPLLSRYAARGDMPNLRDSLNRALRLALMEGLATGTGLYILAEPLTWLLYRHGNFTPADVAQSAGILRMYVMGMWAYCSCQILPRAFYAAKDTVTPLKISCSLAIVDFSLVSGLIWVPGVGAAAFGLATAITFSLIALVMGYTLRKRWGAIGGRKLALSVGRSLAACAAMAAVLWAMQHWLLAAARPAVIVAACVPAGALVFLTVAFLLRAPELGELLGPLAEKLRKKKGTGNQGPGTGD